MPFQLSKSLIAACLFIFLSPAQAAEGIYLNFNQGPDQYVRTVTTSSSEMELNAMGDSQFMEQMTKKGQKFPIRLKNYETQRLSSQTGKPDSNGSFSFSRVIEDVAAFSENENGERINLPLSKKRLVGLVLNGKVDRDGKMTFVSVDGPNVDDETIKMVSVVFDQLGSTSKLRSGPLSVGDSFITETPLEIPSPNGMSAKFNMRSRYTLKKVENGRAVFDVASDFLMAVGSTATIKGSGSGSGSMIYNIKSGLQEKVDDVTQLKMVIQAGQALISSSITSTSTTEQFLAAPDDPNLSPSNQPANKIREAPAT